MVPSYLLVVYVSSCVVVILKRKVSWKVCLQISTSNISDKQLTYLHASCYTYYFTKIDLMFADPLESCHILLVKLTRMGYKGLPWCSLTILLTIGSTVCRDQLVCSLWKFWIQYCCSFSKLYFYIRLRKTYSPAHVRITI